MLRRPVVVVFLFQTAAAVRNFSQAVFVVSVTVYAVGGCLTN